VNLEMLVATVAGLVWVVNQAFPQYKKYSPLMAAVLGVILGHFGMGNWYEGLQAAMMAVGAWSGVKNVAEGVRGQ